MTTAEDLTNGFIDLVEDAEDIGLFVTGMPAGWRLWKAVIDDAMDDAAWKPVDADFIRTDPQTCEHLYTACHDCLESWLADWEFQLVRNGEAG